MSSLSDSIHLVGLLSLHISNSTVKISVAFGGILPLAAPYIPYPYLASMVNSAFSPNFMLIMPMSHPLITYPVPIATLSASLS